MRNEYPLYLNGAWTPQTDGCVREDIEPATGKPLFTVHRAGPADVETALASAAAAFPGWAAAMADVRERVLLRAMLPVFEGISDWCDENILAAMTGMAEKCECKNAKVMWPVRIAAAGKAVTPGGAVEICRILGKDETLRRMRVGIEKLEKSLG